MKRPALLERAFLEADAVLDWLKYRIRRRRGPGVYHIQPYRGHGTGDHLIVSGRVLEGEPVPPARADDARLRNFAHAVRRLASDDVPAARVRVTAGSASVTSLADDEGYFRTVLPIHTDAHGDEVWREVTYELLDPTSTRGPVTTTGAAVVPPEEARFGVISDIDDTVVHTDVANLLRMLRLVLLTNAHTRLPFPGVAAFYRALHTGAAGPFTNPVFYVSSGPWNFYDLIMEVFAVHDVPAGPVFLKDFGLARDLLLSRGHLEHKLTAIDHILDTHPGLPFILIGDSGQKDPEVYRNAVRRHPDRIAGIYIRDVSGSGRDREVDAIAREVAALGVDLLRVRDTVTAARHAAARGFIDESALDAIHGERLSDLAAPTPFDLASLRAR